MLGVLAYFIAGIVLDTAVLLPILILLAIIVLLIWLFQRIVR